MSQKGLDMLQVKQIIRLHGEGKSYRDISKSLGNSRKVVTKYILLFESTGLSYDEIKDYSEAELFRLLSEREKPNDNRLEILHEVFPKIEHELKEPGVTRQGLWSEYKVEHPDGYNYTQFCLYFNKWLKSSEVTMHFEHKSGDKMYVDFAGHKMKLSDRTTGEVHDVEVFVAILGASRLTYVEAVPSQKIKDFIKVVENALHYFGGVPAAIVPDNLKSAVTKADRYEPELNHTFAGFGLHYGTAILPARSRKPRDKSLVEGAVKIAYSRIYAPLRHRTFTSVKELNEAIWEELEKHNDTKFQGKDYSRRELFDQIERQALGQLPATRYEIKETSASTVYKNSYIWLGCDKHYYSVPFRYIGKKVRVETSASSVEVYDGYERIAYHKREYGQYGYTTIPDHMPSSHRFVSDWSPEKFLGWASTVGQETEKVIGKILESKQHPEQAYKSCVGILAFGKKVGYERLNNACRRADKFKSYSYRTIKNILNGNIDNLYKETEMQYQLPAHENVRGSEYYN